MKLAVLGDPWPTISPASLIERASCKYKGEPGGMRVLRSIILWSRQTKAN